MDTILVITGIRPNNEGNLCDEPVVLPDGNWTVKVPVFALGEILIVDESGREVSGWGRKPSKWWVEYQAFPLSDLDKAIQLSRSLSALEE